MADLVELSAPRPWLLLATAGDYFTPEGARLAYTEARRWYSLYRAEDNVRLFVGPGPHGTPLETREAIYKWMIDWLKGGSGDFHEQPAKLYTNQELLVTRTGNVADEPRSRQLYQLILDEFHARERPGTIAEFLAELRRLGVPSEGPAPAVKIVDESNTQDYRLNQIRFEGEPGVEIAAKLYIPRSAGRKAGAPLLEDKPLAVPLQLAAAVDPRLGKIWLDRTPYSLRAALESSMSTNLFDAVIPGFALHWDLGDLTKAMGNRPVLWTDPTNWMGHLVAVGPRFRYRYVQGDITDMSDAQDHEYTRELFK